MSNITNRAEGGCAAGTDTPPGVPAPGGAAAPLLDIGCGNVPQYAPRKPWTRKQWTTRRTVLDRLNYWQANGYQCLWMTLTSSPSSPGDQIRKDFQKLRKRMMRQLFTYKGKPVAWANTKKWRDTLKHLGIEDFRWHDLRHTWATWQRQAGTPTHELQRLGGWRTGAMVERYAHLAPDHLAYAASRLNSVLGPVVTI